MTDKKTKWKNLNRDILKGNSPAAPFPPTQTKESIVNKYGSTESWKSNKKNSIKKAEKSNG